jgi:ABC-type polysaccharide/polyol phosphate export permease
MAKNNIPGLARLRRNGTVFSIFLQREIFSQYLGSLTSVGWAILAPLALLAIYGFVFQEIFKVRFLEADLVGFLAYLALGMWPWLAFSESINRSTNAITSNTPLIHKTALPYEMFVYSTVLATFLIHLGGYILVLLTLALIGKPLVWAMLPVALYFLCLVLLLAVGLGLFVAALRVFLKDIQHAMPLVLTVWFFATPVIYSPSLLPESARAYMNFNPMAYIIERIRQGMLFGEWHPSVVDGCALFASVAVLLIGRWFVRRCSPRFEDFL